MRSAISRIGVIGGVALAVIGAMAIPAGATITQPAAGNVSGTVTLNDDGTTSPGCTIDFGAFTAKGSTNMYVDQGTGTAITSTAALNDVGGLDNGTATIVNLGTSVSSTNSTNPQSGSWNSDNWGNGTYTVNSVENGTHQGPVKVLFVNVTECLSGPTTNAKTTVNVLNTGSLSYTGVTTADQNTTIPVSATLLDQNQVAPAAGQVITFSLSGGSTVTANTNAAGTATTTLPVGLARSATLTITSNANYFTAATFTHAFTVNPDPTTTTLTPLASTTYGNTATLTATVTSNDGAGVGTPTGVVQFKDGTANLGSPVGISPSGVASFSTSTLATGTHSITAVYNGDSNFAGSTSAAANQVVALAPTTVAITTSVQPSTFGQSIVYTATVTATSPGPTTGAPIGTVSFSTTSGIDFGGAVTLTPSGANVSTAQSPPENALNAGSYTAVATYAPSCSGTPCVVNFAAGNSTTLQTVNPAQTTVGVTSTQPSVSDFGQSVQFTATVSTSAPGQGAPTGSVTFVIDAGTSNATTLGTAPLGSAGPDASTANSPSVSNLTPGLHTITATYANTDGNYVSGSHNFVDQFVAPDPSTTTVSTVNNSNPSVFGQPVQFQATVTLTYTDAGTPTGVVLFFVNGPNPPDCNTLDAGYIGTISLINGVATTPPDASLAVGSNTISACYASLSNSADYGSSTTQSPQYVQTVNPDPTTTTLTSANSPDNGTGPSLWGQPVTFTAAVAANAPGAGTPLGTVTFTDGSNSLGTVALSGGTTSDNASVTTAALAVGSHAIKAVYNPAGPDFVTSNAALNHTVNQDPTTLTLTQNGSSVQGQSISFTATITANAPGAGTPTGSVEFFINGADIFGGPVGVTPGNPTSGSSATSTSIAALTPGSYQVTAVYSGDPDFITSTETIGQIVNQAGTSTSLAISPSAASVTFGTPVSLTATVAPTGQGTGLPTGSVDFYDGTTLLGSEALTTVGGVQTATLPVTVYAQGAHSFSAVYLGEYDYTGSTSSSVAQSVSAISTTTALASSVNPSLYSVPVTFTATVTPSSNAGPGPGGTVTFSDGSTVLGIVPVSASGGHFTASYLDSAPAVGTHVITASYSGSTDYASSAAPALSQVVNKDGTVLTAAASSNTTMTAALVSAQGAPLSGQTLSFSSGGTVLCTGVTATNGTASCTATGFDALELELNGTYTATYAGNASYLGSSGSAKG